MVNMETRWLMILSKEETFSGGSNKPSENCHLVCHATLHTAQPSPAQPTHPLQHLNCSSLNQQHACKENVKQRHFSVL